MPFSVGPELPLQSFIMHKRTFADQGLSIHSVLMMDWVKNFNLYEVRNAGRLNLDLRLAHALQYTKLIYFLSRLTGH